MSKLKTAALENLAGTRSTSSDNIIAGCAKAWVNFNGSGVVAIRSSFNVSSITDNGAGDYTVNFTTAFPNVDYLVSGTIGNGDVSNVSGFILRPAILTVSSLRYTSSIVTTNVSAFDTTYQFVAIHSN